VPTDRSRDLDTLRAQIHVELQKGEVHRSRIIPTKFEPASLMALREASAAAGFPVMLYWTTPTAVVAWYVGPHGSQVRSVFLPEDVLKDKVERILATTSDDGQAFDAVKARELYLYLVAPFEGLLDAQQVLIIPQGPLFVLPFETLIDPKLDKPIIERWTVSYAPNAGRALAALRREIPGIRQVTAIVDTEVDEGTKETKGITAATGLQLKILPSSDIPPARLAEYVAGAESLHLLMHGEFNPVEPLLSELRPGGRDPILAAELVNLPIGGLRLAVLSACESAWVGQRVSNEIFGFTWALLAGGADTAVLSRWRVQGDSNGVNRLTI
jgi:CHAT domain-containing protein